VSAKKTLDLLQNFSLYKKAQPTPLTGTLLALYYFLHCPHVAATEMIVKMQQADALMAHCVSFA